MSEFYQELLLVMSVQCLALISPGPDFFIVVRNSVAGSRKLGFWTGAGISAGLSVHVTYSVLGLGYVIASSVPVFTTIRYLGAAYLIYLGFKALRPGGSGLPTDMEKQPGDEKSVSGTGILSAFRAGFITNVLNPKCTLFILSLFSTVIDKTTPVNVQVLYGCLMVLSTFCWFSLVSYIFSFSKTRNYFQRFAKTLNRCFGGILILFGSRLAIGD